MTWLPFSIPLAIAIWAMYDLRRLTLRFKAQDVEAKLRTAIVMYSAGQTEEGNKHLDAVITSMRKV